MKDEVLKLLHQRASLNLDQGLEVAEIVRKLDVNEDAVLQTLGDLERQGLAHKESFWWYPGPGRHRTAGVDQA